MLAVSTTNFISLNGTHATIDGNAADTKLKTQFYDGETGVQLRRARTEESGFDWASKNITEVTINNTIVYDATDVSCIAWFVIKEIKINLSNSHIAPSAVNHLREQCQALANRGIKAVKGSQIDIPVEGGYSGMGRTYALCAALKAVGFSFSCAGVDSSEV